MPTTPRGCFASTIAASCSWKGAAALLTTTPPLVAFASWTESGQLLFELAERTCASCADPNQAMGTAAATAGSLAALLAGAAAAGATDRELERYGEGLDRWRDGVFDWREAGPPRAVPLPLQSACGPPPTETLDGVAFVQRQLATLPKASFSLTPFLLFDGAAIAADPGALVAPSPVTGDMPFVRTYVSTRGWERDSQRIRAMLPVYARRLRAAAGWGDDRTSRLAFELIAETGHGLVFRSLHDR